MESIHAIMTPEQAADYLQVNRETVYRYIRDGRLLASRIGRGYRIPRRSVEQLLWSNRTRSDIALRNYSDDEIEAFLAEDRLSPEAEAIVRRIERATGQTLGSDAG